MVLVEPRNIIGRKISQIRKLKGITQEDLAARLNVQRINIDRPMISKIENQTREILDYEIKGMSVALCVPIEDFFK